jgi:lipopolysaccharide export system protein LptC
MMVKRLLNISFGIALIGVMCVSCENKMEVIEALSDASNKPELSAYNFETLYSDSGKVKVRMVSPEWHQYNNNPKPYRAYPLGLHSYLLDDSLKVRAEISALYVKNYIRQNLWEARKNVVVVNQKGDRLTTEELFWDQDKHVIFSKKYCRIVTPDGGEHIGNCGLQAKEDFTDWKLLCPAWSTIIFKDESAQ